MALITDDNSSDESFVEEVYSDYASSAAETSEDDDFEIVEKPKTSAKGGKGKKAKSPAAKKKATASVPKKKATTSRKASGSSKASASTENIKETVIAYFRKTNRPYSIINVFDNLHRAFSKPALTTVMDELCESTDLASKLYGKSKIYYMNQQNLPLPSEEEMATLEAQITERKERLQEITAKSNAMKDELRCLVSSVSDEQLNDDVSELQRRREELDLAIKKLRQANTTPVSPSKKEALKERLNLFKNACKIRKRIVKNAVEEISEGMEKTPAQVKELIEIEEDTFSESNGIPLI